MRKTYERNKTDTTAPCFRDGYNPKVQTPSGFPIKTPNPLLSFLRDPGRTALQGFRLRGRGGFRANVAFPDLIPSSVHLPLAKA